MLDVCCVEIDHNLTDTQIQLLRNYISRENDSRLDKFRFRADLLRTLYGELLARYRSAALAGTPAAKLEIRRSEYGKPYFGNADLHFNISHSGAYAACAVSDSEVGLDIEEMCDIDIHMAKSIFSASERERILGAGENKQQAFFEIWTIREAYSKFIGKGFYAAQDSFCLDTAPDSNRVLGVPEAFYKQYALKNSKCAVCSACNAFPAHMGAVSSAALVAYFLHA